MRQCELYLRKTGVRSAHKKGDQKTIRQAEIDSGSFPRDEVFSQTASVTNTKFATSEVNGWSLKRPGGSTIYVNPARATRTDVPPETLYNPAHYLAAAKWNFGCAPTQSVYSYAIFEMARMLGRIAESAALIMVKVPGHAIMTVDQLAMILLASKERDCVNDTTAFVNVMVAVVQYV
ncbi:MAG: hypothetical protein GY696_16510, partial [Gammaproteobacteria bacterium]|nr:hypothetical protein [Gammaproteobacteria bacterium]